jgi:hypothetical protein
MRILRRDISQSQIWHTYQAICAMLLILLIGCGGSSSSPTLPTSPPLITSVSISGSGFTQASVCAKFTATVSGTGSYDRSVQWYVNDMIGGSASDGLISSSGTYCAPSQLPATNPISIKAVANGDTSKSADISTRVVAITISPTQVQMYTGATQQFTALISGAISNSIAWEVNGTVGGNSSVGTISSTGLYSAPAQFTNVAISVEAALAEAPTIYAGANLNLSAQLEITPQNPQLMYGGTQQFAATLNGSSAQVNWAATYGSISPSGLYTASATQSPDTVRAWQNNASGSTSVRIIGINPTITSISPQPATAIDQITITGTNLRPIATVVFPNASGGQIPVTGASVGTNSAGTAITVTVPQGSVSGPLFVLTQQGTLAPLQSNTLQFRRLARLRIRSPEQDLSAGESVTMKYALLGDSTPRNITLSADLGSFSGLTYQAPAVVVSDSFAHIRACIPGTNSCDKLILGLHPFRISPEVPLVETGQSLQLSAILGGGVAGSNWSLLAGGGSLSSSGLYDAGTTTAAGGPAIISATGNNSSERTQIGVIGAFPGLVNRINDYIDQHQQDSFGTFVNGLTVVGNRMYVAAGNHLGAYNNIYFWIDVYDITDALHPLWLTAVEANSAGPLFATGEYLYSYQSTDIAVPGYPNTLTIYKLQNQIPVLKTQIVVPAWDSLSDNQGVLTFVPELGDAPQGSVEITIYDLTSGSITSRDFNILLPTDANYFTPDTAIAVGNRLFVSEETNDLMVGGYLLTYDLSTSPPALVGTINDRSLAFQTSGNFLFGALGGMNTYDISGQLPQILSHVDGVNASQLRGTQLLARTLQQGFRMIDLSDPQAPKQTAILFDGVIEGSNLNQWVGNYIYEVQGDGGIAIFDASAGGGPVERYSLYGGPHLSVTANDMVWQSPNLYAATATRDGAVLSVYDTSSNPISRVGEYLDVTQQGLSVDSVSNYVYFGMNRNMAVINVSQPTSPSLVASVPVSAFTLAHAGNSLFAGTSNKSIVVMDISNPAHPTQLSAISLPSVPIKLRVSNNLLFVADGSGGLLIYDISAPASPVLLSRTTLFTAVNDAVINGSTVFVAAGVDGLGILDISNPAHPTFLSKTSLSRFDPFSNFDPLTQVLSMGMNNGLVYVGTDANAMVFGFDCGNLAVPRVISKYAYGAFTSTGVGSLLFNGNELIVGGTLNSGVYPATLVDISKPYDSIEEYFPPIALQSAAPVGAARPALNKISTSPEPRALHRFQSHTLDATDHLRPLVTTAK